MMIKSNVTELVLLNC